MKDRKILDEWSRLAGRSQKSRDVSSGILRGVDRSDDRLIESKEPESEIDTFDGVLRETGVDRLLQLKKELKRLNREAGVEGPNRERSRLINELTEEFQVLRRKYPDAMRSGNPDDHGGYLID